MRRRFHMTLVMLCILVTMLPAAQLLDLAARQIRVADNALDAVGNSIHMASARDTLLVAYQGKDTRIYLAASKDNLGWNTKRLDMIPRGNVQGLAASGSLVVIGYAVDGQLFTVSSQDGGATFLPPVAVIPSARNASIQDMAIDGQGVIHIMFHRHDSFWDYNHARSADGGKSYRTFLDFTKASDSNSTGYAGNLVAAHGNLYTVYQDNNDEFAVKLGVSSDGGGTWRITRLAPSTGGKLGLAVDPKDPDLVYVAAFNPAGLTILRIKGATTASLEPWPVYGDGSLSPKSDSVVTVHIAAAADGTVAVVYLNPVTGSYGLLTSTDRGDTWEQGILGAIMNPTRFAWSADLLGHGKEFFFARTDGKGAVLAHGPKLVSTAVAGAVHTPDSSGLVALDDVSMPFGIVLDSGMPMVLFSVPEGGDHVITHLTQDSIPLYLSLYDLEESGDKVLAENYDGSSLFDTVRHRMDGETSYLLVLGVLDDATLGKTARFEITMEASKDVPVPVTAPPVATVASATSAHRVIAAYFNSFALSKTGTLHGTGLNEHGQLGDGSTTRKRAFTSLSSGIIDVAGGFGHTLMITSAGELLVTGRNEDSQLGDGTKTKRLVPYRLADHVVSAAAGYGHTLYVRDDGSVWAVGANAHGQLGDGTTTNRSTPVKILGKGGVKVVSNYNHTSFILTEDGTLLGFGNNESGLLGLGHANRVASPTHMLDEVSMVAAGASHTVVLKKDGSVWTSGNNSNGQLGTGNQTSSNRFIRVATDVVDIAAGSYNTYLVMRDKNLRIAGSNQYGQYGTGNTTNASVSGGFISVLDKVVDVDGGRSHTVVLREDGSIWTAGSNEQSQLGDVSQGFRTTWKEVFRF